MTKFMVLPHIKILNINASLYGLKDGQEDTWIC